MRKKGERITSLHDFRKKGHSKLENKKKYPTFDLAIYSKFLKSLKHARLAFLEFVSTILPTFYVTNSNEKMFHHISCNTTSLPIRLFWSARLLGSSEEEGQALSVS